MSAGARGCELAGPGQVDGRLERRRRHVVVRVAVGQGEGAEPLGVAGREDLRDGAAGVVGDEVDAGQVERLAEGGDRVGQRRERVVAVRRRRRPPVQRQVESDRSARLMVGAALRRLELREDVAPQVGVGADAVYEEGDRAGRLGAGAGVEVADVAPAGGDELAVAVEVVQVHPENSLDAVSWSVDRLSV